MNLLEKFELIKNKQTKYNSRPGTVYRVFEICEEYEKDESGFKPVIVKPEIEEKKIKKSLN